MQFYVLLYETTSNNLNCVFYDVILTITYIVSTHLFSVNGNWSPWSDVQCDTDDCCKTMAARMRYRSCSNPTPSKDGAKCTGPYFNFTGCQINTNGTASTSIEKRVKCIYPWLLPKGCYVDINTYGKKESIVLNYNCTGSGQCFLGRLPSSSSTSPRSPTLPTPRPLPQNIVKGLFVFLLYVNIATLHTACTIVTMQMVEQATPYAILHLCICSVVCA